MTVSEPSENRFTFIQLNFWEGRLYYPLITFLNRESPDIFAAQEVITGAELMTPAYMTQEELMQKRFFEHVSEGYDKPWMIRKNTQYNIRCATFAKSGYAILEEKRIDLYQTPGDVTEATKAHDAYTGLLHNVVQLPDGRIVHILNHHERVVIGGRMGGPVADANFKMIADYIATLDGPVILSGDFNIYKEAPSLAPLVSVGMTNLNDTYSITTARNQFSWKPEESVSHVFVSNHIIVHDYHVAPDLVSDHQPMVLHFSVQA